MKCILCHSANTHLLETIPKENLNHLYHKSLRINTSSLIKNDLRYLHCKDCDLRFFTDTQDKVPTGDGAFYNSLNQLQWYYFSYKHEYDYVRDFITQDSSFQNPRILEVGCGKAAFAKYLPENAQYVGLELSTQAKQMAQSQGIHIENITIEEFAKTHQDEFDISCSFQVLEHVSNPYEFLRAQIACLKSDKTIGGAKVINYRCA